jgi:hypothetical protein
MTARVLNPKPLVEFSGKIAFTSSGSIHPPQDDALGERASTPGVDYGPEGLILMAVFPHPDLVEGGVLRVYKVPGHSFWNGWQSDHAPTSYMMIRGFRGAVAKSEPAGRWRTALDQMRAWAVEHGYESSLFLYERAAAAKTERKARLDRIYQTVCDVLAEQGCMIGDRPGRAALDGWPETALFTIEVLADRRERRSTP